MAAGNNYVVFCNECGYSTVPLNGYFHLTPNVAEMALEENEKYLHGKEYLVAPCPLCKKLYTKIPSSKCFGFKITLKKPV